VLSQLYPPYQKKSIKKTIMASLTELGHEVYIFAPGYPKYEKEARVFRFMSVPSPTYPEFCIALPFSLYLQSCSYPGLDHASKEKCPDKVL
jgi:1,2-diacylglycerol 3-alpha-glucosyltransferase